MDTTRDASRVTEDLKSRARDNYEYVKDQAGEKYEELKDRAGAAYEGAKEKVGEKYEDMRDRANRTIENDVKPALGMEDKELEAPIEPSGIDPEMDNLATAEAIQCIAEEEQSYGSRAADTVRDAAQRAGEKISEGAEAVRDKLSQ